MTFFSEEFINWLDDHADQIDKESCAAGNQLIERIASSAYLLPVSKTGATSRWFWLCRLMQRISPVQRI